MEGPPISIFSMASSRETPSFAIVFSKGYRFTTTISIGLIPSSFICFLWESLFLNARSPPCTFGCSVFTRPSIISGNPVYSEISITAMPFSFSNLQVPPVEIISMPNDCNSFANVTIPVLSETLISARSNFAIFFFLLFVVIP